MNVHASQPRAAYVAQTLRAEAAGAIAGPWAELFETSVESNPFYGPDYLLPLAGELLRPRDWFACVVWRRAADGSQRLAAFAPIEGARPFGPVRALRHPYIVGGAPLLSRDDPQGAAAALLDEIGRHGLFVLDDMREGAGALDALLAAAQATGRRARTLARRERAAVFSGEPHRPPLDAKDMRRRMRRLAECGVADYTPPASREENLAALEAFMALEASGWKGEARTALACDPRTEAFARRALHPDNRSPAVRFDHIRLDGRCVAVNAHLVGPTLSVSVKAAYDETLRRVSPGFLLDAEIARSLVETKWTPLLDSVAVPGHGVERIWPARLATVDLAIGLARGGGEFEAHFAMERLRRSARALAKDVYGRLRQRRDGRMAPRDGGD